MTFLRFVMFTFWNYHILKLLRLETITFSDATISDINVVLCYALSKYQIAFYFLMKKNRLSVHCLKNGPHFTFYTAEATNAILYGA